MTEMPEALPPQDPWHATTADVVPAVVNIVFGTTSGFGRWGSSEGQATGMVVSTEHGLILTNRHVVAEGSTQSYAIFGSGTCQCSITPCYVDPIHDFAICQYKVKDLKNYTAKQIELKPELAKVGLEIRVIGNDKAEVLSILLGVISRLDHNSMPWDARRYTSIFTFSF